MISPRLFLSILLAASFFPTSISEAQFNHGDYGVSVPAHPPRISLADPTNGKAKELSQVHLTDYEVWVVDRDSTQLKFKLHLLDRWGWTTHQSVESNPWHTRDTLFDSREEAVAEYRRLQRSHDIYIDYEIETINPDPHWQYVATLNTRAEADSFLNLLLNVFSEYDGIVIPVRRELPAMKR